MKRLFVIIVALFVGFAYGANENVPTSKKFVDDALAQKQPKFDGLGNDKLMLYSNTTDGVVASRDIVTTLGNSTSDTSVPTVGAINAGLNTKQDILNGDAGWVAENTGIAGAVVQKPVYSATNNYSNALVEVETLNNAVINAVNSELTVVPGVGWTINTADNLNLLSVPNTYSQILPNGYTQLEYLESTGTQYIDTGVVGKSGISVEATVLATSLESYNCFIGNRDSGTTRFFPIFTVGHTWDIAVNEDHMVGTVATNTKYHIRFISSNTGVTFFTNGTLTGNHSATNNSNTTNMYMFAVNYGNATVQYQTHGRIYDMKIHYNNTPVRNFVPAKRNSDSKLGMYDLVSGTFFTNSGTGNFIAGPAVNTYLPQGN